MTGNTSIIELKGIGAKTEKLFHKLNIYTVNDLLKHYPVKYDTLQAPVHVRELINGRIEAVCLRIQGAPALKKVRNLNILNCVKL